MNLSGSNSTRIMSGKRPRFFLQNAGNKGTEKQQAAASRHRFPNFYPAKIGLNISTLHIRKVKFLSKNSILTKPQQHFQGFQEFFTQIF